MFPFSSVTHHFSRKWPPGHTWCKPNAPMSTWGRGSWQPLRWPPDTVTGLLGTLVGRKSPRIHRKNMGKTNGFQLKMSLNQSNECAHELLSRVMIQCIMNGSNKWWFNGWAMKSSVRKKHTGWMKNADLNPHHQWIVEMEGGIMAIWWDWSMCTQLEQYLRPRSWLSWLGLFDNVWAVTCIKLKWAPLRGWKYVSHICST